MSAVPTMRAKLEKGLRPQRLEIIDESDQHAGHGGARSGGETHFRIEVVSPEFSGLSRVARQRLIYDLLARELQDHIHALSIKALAPEEASN